MLGLAGCDQPAPKCNVTQSLISGGNFATHYEYVAGSKTGMGDCDKLKSEVVYFGSYYAEKGDPGPKVELKDQHGAPDYNKVSIAIQPGAFDPGHGWFLWGAQVSNAQGAGVTLPDVKPYAYGAFTGSEPGDDNLCKVTKFSNQAQLELPAVPKHTVMVPDPADMTGMTMISMDVPAAPALSVEYDYSDVKVWVTPESPGSQVSFEFTYKLNDHSGNNCTAKYKALALFPETNCGSETDPMTGGPAGKPVNKLCTEAEAFSQVGGVKCDPDILKCVLAKGLGE